MRRARKRTGKLPDSFFEPDEQGMVTAVDTGMMSTSDKRDTPIHYIKGGLGVLFVLHCKSGDDATGAQHIGAVLTPLSQYPAETETLFPPLTMLSVMKDEAGEFMISDVKSGSVMIKEIHVTPSFV